MVRIAIVINYNRIVKVQYFNLPEQTFHTEVIISPQKKMVFYECSYGIFVQSACKRYRIVNFNLLSL